MPGYFVRRGRRITKNAAEHSLGRPTSALFADFFIVLADPLEMTSLANRPTRRLELADRLANGWRLCWFLQALRGESALAIG